MSFHFKLLCKLVSCEVLPVNYLQSLHSLSIFLLISILGFLYFKATTRSAPPLSSLFKEWLQEFDIVLAVSKGGKYVQRSCSIKQLGNRMYFGCQGWQLDDTQCQSDVSDICQMSVRCHGYLSDVSQTSGISVRCQWDVRDICQMSVRCQGYLSDVSQMSGIYVRCQSEVRDICQMSVRFQGYLSDVSEISGISVRCQSDVRDIFQMSVRCQGYLSDVSQMSDMSVFS